MNTIRSAAAVATVLAAGVGTIAALTATDAASAGTAQARSWVRSDTFTLHVHQSTDDNIDLGHTGFSAGDQDLFTARLTRSGMHAGRLVGSCTTVRVGKSTADQLCEFVLRLHHGQLTATGTVTSTQQGPGTFMLPIVGGTGRYHSAAGQITVTATSGDTFPIAVSLR
jgi:hypothetical protein